MSAALSPYELVVLRGHKNHPRRESEVPKRQAAQLLLASRGYIELKNGVYRITPAGKLLLNEWKS